MNVKIKKAYTTLILGFVLSSFAFAADSGNVETTSFLGSISSQTCNFYVEQNLLKLDRIDLGTADLRTVNKQFGAKEKPFYLVGELPNGNPCAIGDGTTTEVTWQPASGKWAPDGLIKIGTATNAIVNIKDITYNSFNF